MRCPVVVSRTPINFTALKVKDENGVETWLTSLGTMRVLVIEDVVWFVGKDMAQLLGYVKPRNAIAKHVDPIDKKVAPINSGGGIQQTLLINELGVKFLIMHSTKPVVKPLQLALLESTQVALKDLLLSLNDKDLDKETKAVYVAQFNDNSVKIGVSQNVDNRLSDIQRDTRLTLINRWNTDQVEKMKAFEIEKQAHEYFSLHRIHGEFFDVFYLDACEKVKEFYKKLS